MDSAFPASTTTSARPELVEGLALTSPSTSITTSAEPPKGKDVITIEGIARANKDFGAGYSYAAIVEEAKIIK